jgi:hypothetical protein
VRYVPPERTPVVRALIGSIGKQYIYLDKLRLVYNHCGPSTEINTLQHRISPLKVRSATFYLGNDLTDLGSVRAPWLDGACTGEAMAIEDNNAYCTISQDTVLHD